MPKQACAASNNWKRVLVNDNLMCSHVCEIDPYQYSISFRGILYKMIESSQTV